MMKIKKRMIEMEEKDKNSFLKYRYEVAKCDSKDFIELSNELDRYLDLAIGGAEKREKYKDFNHLDTMDYVLIAYADDLPIGCGALREYLNEEHKRSIEMKRVYVKEAYRSQGIATGMMQRMLDYARKHGYEEILLETGEFLREACRLYARFGFERIPKYGVYAKMEESLCMRKELMEIHYSHERIFDEEEVRDLYDSVGWLSARYSKRLVQAFHKAGTVISAWEHNHLIGLVEVLDDGELTAYIHYLLVRPEYQRQGVGKRLLELVKERYQDYLYLIVISEEPRCIGFYEEIGFTCMNQATPLHILKAEYKEGAL